MAKAPLLEGKKGLIVGIANDQSIAWGCARAFRALGAELAITYLNEKAKKLRRAAGEGAGSADLHAARCQRRGPDRGGVRAHREAMGRDGFPDPFDRVLAEGALHGRVVDVSTEGFLTTMDVSCWSFLRMAHLAEPLMKNGGSMFAMTYYGSERS